MNERYSFADLGSGWGSTIKTETGKTFLLRIVRNWLTQLWGLTRQIQGHRQPIQTAGWDLGMSRSCRPQEGFLLYGAAALLPQPFH